MGLRRSMSWVDPGFLRIDQEIEVAGRETGTDAPGPYWVFALVRVRRGRIQYLHGRTQVEPPRPAFAVFIPAWSIVQVHLERCRVSTVGFASSGEMPSGLPPQPIALAPVPPSPPRSLEEIPAIVAGAEIVLEISREQRPTPFSRRVKDALDGSYGRRMKLREIATKLAVSPSLLSRCFKRDYGIPPVEYRHRIRVMDAMFRIPEGRDILGVADDVGFEDLSRLYRHFRSLLCAPPGQYRLRRSRNAKT